VWDINICFEIAMTSYNVYPQIKFLATPLVFGFLTFFRFFVNISN